MNYLKLGKTGLLVSEVGFGGEWLERHDVEHREEGGTDREEHEEPLRAARQVRRDRSVLVEEPLHRATTAS